MTSTADTTQHPDVSEISDLTEGLLSPSRTAEVRRHVDECGICGEVLVSLEEIRGLLGALPAPERMPDDIADRIDAALAAEPLRASDDAADVSRETQAVVEHGQEAGDQETEGQETRGRETQPTLADRPTGYPRATTGPGRRPAQRRRRDRSRHSPRCSHRRCERPHAADGPEFRGLRRGQQGHGCGQRSQRPQGRDERVLGFSAQSTRGSAPEQHRHARLRGIRREAGAVRRDAVDARYRVPLPRPKHRCAPPP